MIPLCQQFCRPLLKILILTQPLCNNQAVNDAMKKEYVKTVMWAAKQIAKTYESKLGPGESGNPTGNTEMWMLDGLLGQLQIQTQNSS